MSRTLQLEYDPSIHWDNVARQSKRCFSCSARDVVQNRIQSKKKLADRRWASLEIFSSQQP